jgi:hypothetical protein
LSNYAPSIWYDIPYTATYIRYRYRTTYQYSIPSKDKNVSSKEDKGGAVEAGEVLTGGSQVGVETG